MSKARVKLVVCLESLIQEAFNLISIELVNFRTLLHLCLQCLGLVEMNDLLIALLYYPRNVLYMFDENSLDCLAFHVWNTESSAPCNDVRK